MTFTFQSFTIRSNNHAIETTKDKIPQTIIKIDFFSLFNRLFLTPCEFVLFHFKIKMSFGFCCRGSNFIFSSLFKNAFKRINSIVSLNGGNKSVFTVV